MSQDEMQHQQATKQTALQARLVAPYDVASLVAVGASLFDQQNPNPDLSVNANQRQQQAIAEVGVSANGRNFLVSQPQQSSNMLFEKPIYRLNFLITGEAGLGKTTFQKNLFGLYTGQVELHDGASTSLDDFVRAPERLSRQITIESRDATAHYHLQDTPGFGETNDFVEYITMIQQYIETLDHRFLAAAEDPERSAPMRSEEDCRVDLCLFFIPAHRIKQMDLNLMKAVSALGVPVLPIIAKADTMTVNETHSFKKEIQRKAREQELEFFCFTDREQQAALEICQRRCADRHGVLETAQEMTIPDRPYAIICSNNLVDETSFVPVREYKWGKCYPLSPSHSDFSFLRSLIMEKGVHRIKASTEKRYFGLRKRHHRWHARLLRKIQSACALVSFRMEQKRGKRTRWPRQQLGLLMASIVVLASMLVAIVTIVYGSEGAFLLATVRNMRERMLCEPFIRQLSAASANASRCHANERLLADKCREEIGRLEHDRDQLKSKWQTTRARELSVCRRQVDELRKSVNDCQAVVGDKANCWL